MLQQTRLKYIARSLGRNIDSIHEVSCDVQWFYWCRWRFLPIWLAHIPKQFLPWMECRINCKCLNLEEYSFRDDASLVSWSTFVFLGSNSCHFPSLSRQPSNLFWKVSNRDLKLNLRVSRGRIVHWMSWFSVSKCDDFYYFRAMKQRRCLGHWKNAWHLFKCNSLIFLFLFKYQISLHVFTFPIIVV